jgi:hypothetical protein
MIGLRSHPGKLILTIVMVLASALPARSGPGTTIWFAPDGDTPDLLDLFKRPNAWAKTRTQINVFKFSPSQVASSSPSMVNTYADLAKVDAFRKLKEWQISIAIEAPAVKEWDCTGKQAARMTIEFVKNVRAAGGSTHFIAMDEPLVSGFRRCHLTFDETATRTAAYVKAISSDKSVKTTVNELEFGDIEPYPSYTIDQLKQWIRALESNRFKPRFFHLDVDLNNVDLHPKIDLAGDLRALKVFLQEQGIPFGIIFWSGHDPESSDKSYYDHVIGYVKRVYLAIGKPEQSIFQSWVLRVSSTCSAIHPCSAKITRCSPSDPNYCGMRSVPLNLPENAAETYSHLRLVNESALILGLP